MDGNVIGRFHDATRLEVVLCETELWGSAEKVLEIYIYDCGNYSSNNPRLNKKQAQRLIKGLEKFVNDCED